MGPLPPLTAQLCFYGVKAAIDSMSKSVQGRVLIKLNLQRRGQAEFGRSLPNNSIHFPDTYQVLGIISLISQKNELGLREAGSLIQ